MPRPTFFRFTQFWMLVGAMAICTASVSAQGVGGAPMTCSLSIPTTPTVRAEGSTERVGDIVLTCSGGSAPSTGSAIPQIDITVFLNTAITSRVVGSGAQGNFSEAMLLVDEP